MQSPIENDCVKVSIDGHTEKQAVPNLLLTGSIPRCPIFLRAISFYGITKGAYNYRILI